jgi:hypothetical protein
VTHTYIQAIKQPTLHYLTRSVRRRAATSKRGYRKWSPGNGNCRVTDGSGVSWSTAPIIVNEDHSVPRPSRRDLVAHRPAEGVLMKKTLSLSLMVFQPSFIC